MTVPSEGAARCSASQKNPIKTSVHIELLEGSCCEEKHCGRSEPSVPSLNLDFQKQPRDIKTDDLTLYRHICISVILTLRKAEKNMEYSKEVKRFQSGKAEQLALCLWPPPKHILPCVVTYCDSTKRLLSITF